MKVRPSFLSLTPLVALFLGFLGITFETTLAYLKYRDNGQWGYFVILTIASVLMAIGIRQSYGRWKQIQRMYEDHNDR